MAFDNRVIGRIFGPTRYDKVAEYLKRMRDEELDVGLFGEDGGNLFLRNVVTCVRVHSQYCVITHKSNIDVFTAMIISDIIKLKGSFIVRLTSKNR